MMQWDLVPFWAKEDNKLAPFNARGETVATSPMFREAFKSRRCLMPASGFYEWKGEKGVEGTVPVHAAGRGAVCFRGDLE
jgi:putative SOS response-associated peptidase YedK